MAYFGRAAVFSKSVLPRPRSNPEAARLQRQGPLSARLGVDVGPKIMNLLPVDTRVIGRFHHQQAKEPAKWLNLGPGLGEASSRFILEKSVVLNRCAVVL